MAFVYWIHLPEHTDLNSEGYIGFTSKTVEKRFKQHKTDSKRYPHLTLYKAMAKYGDDLIVQTLLEGSEEYCLEMENKLRPDNKIGWNIKAGGDVGSLGVIPSEDTRKKMSDARKGEKNHFYGKHHSEETKQKLSVINSQRKASEETRAKQSAARLGKKLNLSEAQRSARSERARSYKASVETKALLSELTKGRYLNWRSPIAGECWLIAEDVYSYISKSEDNNKTSIGRKFGFTYNQIKTLASKIMNGWNPYYDTDYQSWKQQTLKGAECQQTNYSD